MATQESVLRIIVTQYRCAKCAHKWFPQKPSPPVRCPFCQTKKWKAKP